MIQFTGIGLHPTSISTVVGGSQDNGTELTTGNQVWSVVDGGDGGFSQISQSDGNVCYSNHPIGSFGSSYFFRVSLDGCNTWTSKTPVISNQNLFNFYAPIFADPSNGNRVFLGGDALYESTNAGTNWTTHASPDASNPIDTIAVLPGQNTIYISTGGTFASQSFIWVSTNDGGSWINHSLPVSGRVNELDIDPNDSTGQTVIAVLNTFNGANGQVWKTTNGGANWSNISANLPQVPTWSAKIDKDAAHTIYVSNETGVYSSPSASISWQPVGSGLPHVQAVDLELNSTLHILAVATHGRGAWYISTQKATPTVSMASSLNPSTLGASVNITATVSTGSSAIVPTGSVIFTVNGTPIGSPVTLDGTGAATLTTSSLPQGTDSIIGQYSGDANYSSANSDPYAQSVTSTKTNPVITWAAPSAITYGTALSSTQLSATANVAGTFSYSPAIGTYPKAGIQTLTSTFTPTNSTLYNPVTTNVLLKVNLAQLTVTANDRSKTYGASLPSLPVTITGFVHGDQQVHVVTGAASVTTTATASSPFGTYPITPTMGTLAASNYYFTFAAGTLTVNKAVLTVTAAGRNKVYGAALPSLGYTISGLVNGDTLVNAIKGQPALSTTATAASPVAGYPITSAVGTLASANYSFSFVSGTMNVTKAPLYLSASSRTKYYGAPLPTFVFAVRGLVNGDTISSALSGSPAYSTTATSASPVGTYPITISIGTLVSPNYVLSFTGGTLTVTKTALTVTASNLKVAYNQDIPTLTYVLTGFVNGDTAAVVSGAPTLSTTAVKGSAPGTYAITSGIGTLLAKNYNFTPKNGTLQVTYLGRTATPSFSPVAGTYTGAHSVSISTSTVGATIYYTTDGTVPTTSSATYTGSISVSVSETINAIAVAPGYTQSAVGTAAYVIQ